MLIARQSTARTVTVGPVLDASGVAVTDGVVADFKLAKNGGAPAALNGSATLTHRATGHYSLALTAADLDTVGQAEIVIDDTVNACPVKEITVVEEAVYDALFAASAAGYQVPIWAAANSTVNLSATTVNLVNTLTTYTGDTPQTGDSFARIGATGSGLTSLAPSATALSTATWTNGRAANLDNLDAASSTLATTAQLNLSANGYAQVDVVENNEVPVELTAGVELADGAITRAKFAADTGLQTVRSGTCQAGSTASTVVLDAGASASNNLYSSLVVVLTGGTGAGQARVVWQYAGASQTASVSPDWAVTPDDTTTFAVVPHGPASADAWAGFATATNFGTPKVNVDTWGDLNESVPALVGGSGGRLDAAVGFMQSNVITGTALHDSAASEIADKVLGRSVQGGADGGRTVGQYLQGYANKVVQSADGLTFTVYAYDDTTVLQTFDATRLATSVGGLRSVTPA